ncbi:MAG: hypothetical protein MUF43_07870 [Flavobacterium sp.]|jgi:hypothetical protein|nr:hypothetical protein [Flavobacterium sp.]
MSKAYSDFKNKKSNDYLDFMKECKLQEHQLLGQNLKYQNHHIVPRHHYKNHKLDFSSFNNPENLVKLSFEDHIKAHQLRFEVYGEYADRQAVNRMSDLGEENMLIMQQAGGQAVNIQFKREGRLMHDSAWQKEMAARSMSRPDALLIRSIGGKKGSQVRNKNRVVKIEDKFLWKVKGIPFMCTFNFDQTTELLQELHRARPTKIQRISPLINGNKASLNGWSVEKIIL